MLGTSPLVAGQGHRQSATGHGRRWREPAAPPPPPMGTQGIRQGLGLHDARPPSYRGCGFDTYSVEAVPQATKVRGTQPKGV